MQTTTMSPVERRMAFRLLEIIALLLPVLAMLVQIIVTRGASKTSEQKSKERLEASVNRRSARSEISFERSGNDTPDFPQMISILAIGSGAGLLVWSAWLLLAEFGTQTDFEQAVTFVRAGVVSIGIAVLVISVFHFLRNATPLLRRIKARFDFVIEAVVHRTQTQFGTLTSGERNLKVILDYITTNEQSDSVPERKTRSNTDETEHERGDQ